MFKMKVPFTDNSGDAAVTSYKEAVIEENFLDAFMAANPGSMPSGSYMSYSPPEWYNEIDPVKGAVVLFDDYNRAAKHIVNALMELTACGEYYSFKFADNVHIVCTSNPDDGQFNTTMMDTAQTSRMDQVDVEFDIKIWHKWAQENDIDDRVVDFLYFSKDNIENFISAEYNPRSWTKLAYMIKGKGNNPDLILCII